MITLLTADPGLSPPALLHPEIVGHLLKVNRNQLCGDDFVPSSRQLTARWHFSRRGFGPKGLEMSQELAGRGGAEGQQRARREGAEP